eukprot:9392017-Karenia_brevis.AAC.1
MKQYGKQVVLASYTASYTLRGVWPTAASLVLTDEMEKTGVGNWSVQLGADMQPLQVVAASMPVCYSSQRVQIASLAKCKYLIVVRD